MTDDVKIIKRKEAKSLGLKHYFTGRPCKYGHIAKRFVEGGVCIECRLNWRNKNSDHIKANHAIWRAENSDKIKAYYEKYICNNKDRVMSNARARVKKYRSTQIGKINQLKHNSKRRAIKLGQETNWTKKDHERFSKLYKITKRLELTTGKKFHIDHRIPLSRGGIHHPNNMQIVLAKYNLSKGSKTDEEVSRKYKQNERKNK